jgi:hypothetical protein
MCVAETPAEELPPLGDEEFDDGDDDSESEESKNSQASQPTI